MTCLRAVVALIAGVVRHVAVTALVSEYPRRSW